MPSEPWEEIAARLEAASGPDRELGGAICVAASWVGPVQGFSGAIIGLKWVNDGEELEWQSENGEYWGGDAPDLTASVDAILALIAEKLPGWAPNVGATPEFCRGEQERQRPWEGSLVGAETREIVYGHGEPPEIDYDHASSKASTAPLALCAAFARAMARQAGAEEA